MSASTDALPPSGVREQVATRVAFFVVGVVMAAWAPLVPLVRARLGLDSAALGGLLLFGGVGSLAVAPFCGGLAGRHGCRKVILSAGALALVALPVMATASNAAALAVGLLLFGASLSLVDVTMNVQAVIVERASGRAMMSGFHGLWSVGGIVGAGSVTGLLALGASAGLASLLIVAGSAALLAAFARGLIRYGGERDVPTFVLPKGAVLAIGLLCCAVFVSEGSVLDWSGVLLNLDRGLSAGRSGVGYVAFAATMTLGRLAGDVVVHRLGATRILLGGAILAAAGFLLAALAPSWSLSVVGFALVGLGEANLVPVLFSVAGRQRSMPPNLALAATTTVGYAGGLVGPASLGFVARATGLPVAFAFVAALLVVVAVAGPPLARE